MSSPLERLHAAMDRLAEATDKDVSLRTRRAYFEHKSVGAYVAQIDGFQPLLMANATSPDAAVAELADRVEQQVRRMKGGLR
jgi:hypothetical protein